MSKPLDWNVIPSEPAFFKEFICLKQTEEECSLPRFYFKRQKSFGGRRERNFFFRIDLKRKEVFFKLIGMVTEVDEESGEERLVHIVGCFE